MIRRSPKSSRTDTLLPSTTLFRCLRDGFLNGPRFFYGSVFLPQTGVHGDMRPAHQGTDFCGCGSLRNSFSVCADGVDECIKAVREELRKGAHHIKIMGSGGVVSTTDPLDRCQYSDAEISAIVEERSEERRVGKECVSTCRSRWWPYH